MLLTVLLPATNAPRPPMKGEKIGQAVPVREATLAASTIGILSYPAAPPSELMNTCTMGTVKMRATEAAAVVLADWIQTPRNRERLSR